MKRPAIKPWQARNPTEQQAADRAIGFFTRYLKHTKGKFAKQPFTILPWQEHQVLRPLFGTLQPDGLRQYRRAWIEVAKKAGKSELAAGIALQGLLHEDEPMAEVYIGAVDREQAGMIFAAAARMVRMSPTLSKHCRILDSTKRIIVTSGPQEGSILQALASDAPSADGPSPSRVILDEIHRYKNREFADILIESVGAREQPLVIELTTAGTDPESFAWSEHEYARGVLEGVIDDPTMLPVIWAAPLDADFRKPETWFMANPSIGQTVDISFYEARARRASEDPPSENSFRRFHLNQWVSQESRWMPMDRWDAARGELTPEALAASMRSVPCWAGLDLSQTRDLTAFVLVSAPAREGGAFRALVRCWIPEENVVAAGKRDGVRYDRWVEDGWLMTTPGNTIDYDTIERQVRADALRFPLQQVGFDPTYAWQMAQQLERAGIEMWPIRQGFETMAGPTADLLQLIKERRFDHAGNPILRWAADNTVVEQDSLGRWRPSKRKAHKRIDPIVAAIMGLDRAERALFGAPPDEEASVALYDDEVQISPHI